MPKHLKERTDKKVDGKGRYVSVMIEYGDKNSYINGIFIEENSDYFIVKDSKNKVVYIHKNKIICHTFEES